MLVNEEIDSMVGQDEHASHPGRPGDTIYHRPGLKHANTPGNPGDTIYSPDLQA